MMISPIPMIVSHNALLLLAVLKLLKYSKDKK